MTSPESAVPSALTAEVLKAVFDAAIDSIIVIDEFGEIAALNAAAVRQFGYESAASLLGRNVSMLMNAGDAGRHDGYLARYRNTGEQHIIGTGRVVTGRRKDGSDFSFFLSISEFESDGRRMFAGICHRTAELDDLHDRIAWMSTHDHLTGVLNRSGFTLALEQALHDAQAPTAGDPAVLVIDLRGFKHIVDTYGHDLADELLRQTAQRIGTQLRPGDILSRLDSDDFVAVVRAGGQHLSEDYAGRIIQALELPFLIGDLTLRLSATIGIAHYPDHGTSVSELLNHADIAMNRARKQGAAIVAYDRKLRDLVEAEQRLTSQLREAIDLAQLSVAYQPQFDLDTLEIVGLEALARWEHPERGSIPPDVFLPLAAQHGLMRALSRWVIRQACLDNARLIAHGVIEVPVAVNVDAVFFADPTFLPFITDVLKSTGLSPSMLEIEVVENIALANSPQVTANATGLAELGVSLAMDDFGTGYSSLRQLSDQKFNKLKIDRSFVGRIPHNTRDETIITATLDLAASLGLTSIAEGVETSAQRDYLRAQGCTVGQGFWYARPMPLEEFEEWLRRDVVSPMEHDA